MSVSWGDWAKASLKSIGKNISDSPQNLFGEVDVPKIFGDREGTGILGTGQYRADAHEINDGAFTDRSKMNSLDNVLGKEYAKTGKLKDPRMKAAVIDKAAQDQWRTKQAGLATSLEDYLAGRSKSLAEQQMQRATNDNIAAANAQAVSARGVNPALALRATQTNTANINQNAVNQAGILRAQEEAQARNDLASLSRDSRQQDLALAEAQAQLDQGASSNNLQAVLQARQINNQMKQALMSGRIGIENNNRQSVQDLERLKVQQVAGMNNANASAYADAADRRMKVAGGVGEALAKFFAASDKNLKTEISPAEDEDLSKFLDALTAYTYRYKDPKFGEGKQLGPMAQDLEESEIGEDAVIDTPEGKMVDYGKLGGPQLAATAMLHDRVKKLELMLAKAFSTEKKRKSA